MAKKLILTERFRYSHNGRDSRWYEPGVEYDADDAFVEAASKTGIIESLDGEAPKTKKARGAAPENKARKADA